MLGILPGIEGIPVGIEGIFEGILYK